MQQQKEQITQNIAFMEWKWMIGVVGVWVVWLVYTQIDRKQYYAKITTYTRCVCVCPLLPRLFFMPLFFVCIQHICKIENNNICPQFNFLECKKHTHQMEESERERERCKNNAEKLNRKLPLIPTKWNEQTALVSIYEAIYSHIKTMVSTQQPNKWQTDRKKTKRSIYEQTYIKFDWVRMNMGFYVKFV